MSRKNFSLDRKADSASLKWPRIVVAVAQIVVQRREAMALTDVLQVGQLLGLKLGAI